MNERAPRGPQKFRFAEQSDEDFDQLTYLLVRLEFPDAVKMAAPDGGADTLLPEPGTAGYMRAWQAKRYTSNISWSKCRESLERAVERYGVSYVTFCFARNLTENHEQLFRKHLAGRYPGVTVDYWCAAELTGRLIGTAEGARVARHFFGDEDPLYKIERAQRSGGALANRQDANERVLAVGEFMAGHDPYFAYHTVQGETTLPLPSAVPGTVLSVAKTTGSLTVRTDALPRHPEAMAAYGPRGRLLFSADAAGRAAREALATLAARGGRATIDQGVSIAFDQLPPLFADLIGQPLDGSVTISSPVRVLLVSIETDRGADRLELPMHPVDPPPGSQFAVRSEPIGGLMLTISGRWDEAAGCGNAYIQWTLAGGRDETHARARALSFMLALHGAGKIKFAAPYEHGPSVEHTLASQAPPEDLEVLSALFSDVALIERTTGVAIAVPDEVSSTELEAIAAAAELIRAGGLTVRFESLELECEPTSPAVAAGYLDGAEVHEEIGADILGHQLKLGASVIDLPRLEMVEREPISDQAPDAPIRIRLAPAGGEPVELWAKLRLPSDDQRATPVS